MAENAGATIASAATGPDARMSSWPASAGPLLPDTGASTNNTSGRCCLTVSSSPAVASTPIVPICAHTAPRGKTGKPWVDITEVTRVGGRQHGDHHAGVPDSVLR
jgi:hypothetical protein